jgi:hypothetical protein
MLFFLTVDSWTPVIKKTGPRVGCSVSHSDLPSLEGFIQQAGLLALSDSGRLPIQWLPDSDVVCRNVFLIV